MPLKRLFKRRFCVVSKHITKLDKFVPILYSIGMRYYSVEQAAKLSGFHPNTIRRWADDGTIPSFRTKGGHRRVCIDD
ncbi:MAG: helix-turn-helix domain-containing protein, partial [Synergistales bacterium]|nr:helix-turn-helix domain-containing protein [Synergistales bacterium]